MNLAIALRKKLTLPNGKPRRGAFARASEHIGVSYITLCRYMDGSCGIGEARRSLVEDVARGKVNLKPHKLGRTLGSKSKPRAKVNNNLR